MIKPKFDELIHSPTRLSLVSLLAATEWPEPLHAYWSLAALRRNEKEYGEFSPDRRPGMLTGMTELRTATTTELRPGELAALRRMVFAAFAGRFDEHDWEHMLGGIHVLVVDGGEPISHGSVVPRTLVAAGREWRTGYVEGVATRGDRRGEGLATVVMRAVGRVVRDGYELGALADGTRIPGFYQRLGWEPWRGPTFVAGPEGPVRTGEDDGGILVLRTPATAGLEPTGPLVCDWRAGDVW